MTSEVHIAFTATRRRHYGVLPPILRRSTIAARFWITITRVDGFDRTNTKLFPSGEMSKFPCGFAVTIPTAGKSAFRDVTASAGLVAIVADMIVGSARASAFVPLR
jgi:hypothetical protein